MTLMLIFCTQIDWYFIYLAIEPILAIDQAIEGIGNIDHHHDTQSYLHIFILDFQK